MRSVSRRGLGLLAVAVAAGPLAGCTTTQQQAERLQLDSARQLAALRVTRVSAVNPTVPARVEAVIRRGRRTAIVVSVTNRNRVAVTDLPISVAYRHAGAIVYLNDSANAGYFGSHLSAIRAGRSTVWVYTTTATVPPRARLFARVGRKRSAPAEVTVQSLPLGVSFKRRAQGLLSVSLHNGTSVPQYELQVYAYARRAGRYVAAGSVTIGDLGAGSSTHLRLALVGDSAGASVAVVAVPTILE